MTALALLLVFVTGSISIVVRQVENLFRLTDAGYGDSYILYDVQHFQKTGEIYRDLSKPPYLPAQYGPLLYMLYALPGQKAFGNPLFGPRLMALGFYFLCVGMAASIARALIPARQAGLWAVLMATSIASLGVWPVELRGDFPGIFFSLAAIRLLLSRWRHAVLVAGLCAGLAVQFKTTYVAALAAGSLWLLLRRQGKELGTFAAAGATTSIGLYFLYWLREPRMIPQMMALAPGIKDVHGYALLIWPALREPVLLLALAALPLVVVRGWPHWRLLLLYVAASFGIAGLTEIQAGGSINYFYEGLLGLIPLAVLGAFRLVAWSRQHATLAALLAGVILICFWLPRVRDLARLRTLAAPRRIEAANEQFREMQAAVRGKHIFSTVPRMALLDPQPALMEPYLLSYMQRLGKVDPEPILARVRKEEFDVVITGDYHDSWRGIPKVTPVLGAAIIEAYRPCCTVRLGDVLYIFLPRNRETDTALAERLEQAGCAPYQGAGSSRW